MGSRIGRMKIRMLKLKDAETYSQLRNANAKCFYDQTQFTPEQVKQWIKSRSANEFNYVLEENGEAVCFISVYNYKDASFEVGRALCKHKGKGYASMLLTHIMNELGNEPFNYGLKFYANIKVDNIPSQKLFEKCGFKLMQNSNGSLYYEYKPV